MLSFLQHIIQFLNNRNVPYMLSGSVALSIYTLPRATRDFDFIVYLQSTDVDALVMHFKEGFYCDKHAINEALQNHGMFNIIDHASGFKADFVILKNQPFRKMEFSRRRREDFFGSNISVVSPEDLLLSKLIWIQEIQSSLQMEDIKNLVKVPGLDWTYINEWSKTLQLNTFNLY